MSPNSATTSGMPPYSHRKPLPLINSNRPDYKKLSVLKQFFPYVPILALSATCPPKVCIYVRGTECRHLTSSMFIRF